MTPPKNTNYVRVFIVIVDYYRYVWARQSHLLHPLAALTSNKVKFKWTDMEQKYFYDIKCAITWDTLLAYPDFYKRFDIHMNARYCQIVALIIQKVKPIVLYSHKLTGPQTRYTVTEKEFLSIVKTLK